MLAALGSRVPLTLKVFLTTLAIVDDLGAIVVIAIFYTSDLSPLALGLAALFIAGLAILNFAGVRRLLPYLLLGLFPGWLRWLPRPGRWMESFRQALYQEIGNPETQHDFLVAIDSDGCALARPPWSGGASRRVRGRRRAVRVRHAAAPRHPEPQVLLHDRAADGDP